MSSKKLLPKLMGVLNVTPDSSYDKGRHFAFEDSLKRAREIVEEGGDMIDVGGESTRPGAAPVEEAEELRRVLPVIKELRRTFNLPISIDTVKWRVAEAAIEAGAAFINDVTGFDDPEMVRLASATGVGVCVMHMQGTPRTMQLAPYYEEGITKYLLKYFEEKVETLVKAGISKKKIYLDPGIGFGKTVAHNLEIIHNLSEFKKFCCPLLLGLSRKSFMGKINNKTYDELLPETLAIHTVACLNGLNELDFLRVHDVKDNRNIINLLQAYLNFQNLDADINK